MRFRRTPPPRVAALLPPAVAVAALLLVGRADAGLVVTSGQVNDGAAASVRDSLQTIQPWNFSQSTAVNPTGPTVETSGPLSYTDGLATVGGLNSTSGSASTDALEFTLSSTASLSQTGPTNSGGGTASQGTETLVVNFTATSSGLYDFTVTPTYTPTTTDTATTLAYADNEFYLLDGNTSNFVVGPLGERLFADGTSSGSFGPVATQVNLIQGHSYQIYTTSISFASYANANAAPTDVTTVSSTAGLTFDLSAANLSAVPEPSTLVGATTATLLGLGYSWRRRRHV